MDQAHEITTSHRPVNRYDGKPLSLILNNRMTLLACVDQGPANRKVHTHIRNYNHLSELEINHNKVIQLYMAQMGTLVLPKRCKLPSTKSQRLTIVPCRIFRIKVLNQLDWHVPLCNLDVLGHSRLQSLKECLGLTTPQRHEQYGTKETEIYKDSGCQRSTNPLELDARHKSQRYLSQNHCSLH